MQILLSSVLLIVGVSSSFGLKSSSNVMELARLTRSIHEARNYADRLPTFRRKRQLSCLNRCFEPLVEEVEGYDVTSGSLNPDIFFNTQKLESFCSAYTVSKNCLDGCAENVLRDMMELILSTFDGICVNNREEFESYIPCYKSTQEETENTCTARCGGADDLKRLQKRQKLATLLGNVGDLSDIMGEMCTMVSCRKNCETEVITENCENGSEAAALLKDFGIAQFEQLEQQFESDSRLSKYWPSECADLVEEFSSEEEENGEK